MTASETRAQARKSLTNKWGKAALLTLVFWVLTFIISFLLGLVPVVGKIASAVISPALSFGFIVTMFKLKRDEETSYVGFFSDGFKQFGKVWGTIWWTFVKMLLPVVILVISIIVIAIGTSITAVSSVAESSASGIGIALIVVGVIAYIASIIWAICKAYFYKLSLYIVNDNPDIAAKEAVEKSAELMQGNRWRLFCLQFSFIGWAILASFTLGIGYLWLMPYMQISEIEFYEKLAGTTTAKTEE